MSLIATWFSEGRRAQHPPDPPDPLGILDMVVAFMTEIPGRFSPPPSGQMSRGHHTSKRRLNTQSALSTHTSKMTTRPNRDARYDEDPRSANGASCPLPSVTTKVRLLNRLPTLDPAGRDYSSCPQAVFSNATPQSVKTSVQRY